MIQEVAVEMLAETSFSLINLFSYLFSFVRVGCLFEKKKTIINKNVS